MIFKKSYFLFLVLFFNCAFFSSCNSKSNVEVKIFSAQETKAKAKFSAELALSPAERAQGLMFRKQLGGTHAMLFVFPYDTMNPFWMQNTLISLDMIFIDSDKKIVSIVHKAEPQTTTPREPEGFYRYVLEIEGGLSESLEIKVGDRVDFKLPQNSEVR